ncbi:MAG: hypothetical protein U0R81_13505 [Mycobacterium sp.]
MAIVRLFALTLVGATLIAAPVAVADADVSSCGIQSSIHGCTSPATQDEDVVRGTPRATGTSAGGPAGGVGVGAVAAVAGTDHTDGVEHAGFKGR